MHILVVNDDGPPSNQSSPYVHSLVSTLQAGGHTVSVVLPHVQRSWIGKAHIVGQTVTPTYFRPGTLHHDDGSTVTRPFNDDGEEWILIDGTPASCVQIGLHHVFKDRPPVDLVVSGPNYGRNTTAVFALSSGTIGGALEAAVNGKKSIALSYAFTSREHVPEVIAAASKVSMNLIEKLVREWPEDVHLYSINVPVENGVETAKIVYTNILQNAWSGSSYAEVPGDEGDHTPNTEERQIREGDQKHTKDTGSQPGKRTHVRFKWAPNFADVRKSVEQAGTGDGYAVLQGHISVTPLIANFAQVPRYSGEIKLNDEVHSLPVHSSQSSLPSIYAIINHPEPYVQPLILQALKSSPNIQVQLISSIPELPKPTDRLLQFADYEDLDFEHVVQNPKSSLVCAYVIRKALIRKHYLTNTIANWLVKNPTDILAKHYKSATHFEVDYAEFLDDALIEAWELNESLRQNEEKEEKEWWILKPGMSDGGNGIRLFSTMAELQAIFEEMDEEETDDEGDEDDDGVDNVDNNNISAAEHHSEETGQTMTSQLRHFIAQPYIDPPLLLEECDNRKFHIRTYVVAAGALKVFVYREMLALFTAKPYQSLNHSTQQRSSSTTQIEDIAEIDLSRHLTNTCFQTPILPTNPLPQIQTMSAHDPLTPNFKTDLVMPYWSLPLPPSSLESIHAQILATTSSLFNATARDQQIHFQTLPNAFEIFGVDFLVDHRQNVWLLEVNAYPDFKQTGLEFKDVVRGLFEEVVDVVVAPFFGEEDMKMNDRRGREGEGGKEDKKGGKLELVLDIDLGRRA